jgi:hypothetical protein
MQTVTIPLADYERLLDAASGDDMIVYCETCGAWLDRADPGTATTEAFTGCWKAATRDSKYDKTCKSYRATVREFPTLGAAPYDDEVDSR